MKIIQHPGEMQDYSRRLRARDKEAIIALVPTMGALHEGHLSLIRAARRKCSLVVVSIFVNPTQFGPQEDYLSYPRDIDKDSKLAAGAGTDIIFAPTPSQMYPEGYQTFVQVERLSRGLCGASRPGHFRGVATVVCKLFNIVGPDYAYFGQKDYQQALLIKRMAADLNMPTKIVLMPIVRDKDGLALSSRNLYLTPKQRYCATVLHRALQLGQLMVSEGERDPAKIKQALQGVIEQEPEVRIDYIAVCDPQTLEPLEQIVPGKVLLALAVRIGKSRLIDNCLC